MLQSYKSASLTAENVNLAIAQDAVAPASIFLPLVNHKKFSRINFGMLGNKLMIDTSRDVGE